MIYLIDEKKKRQENYNWSEQRLSEYSDILKPIYRTESLIGEKSFSPENIILFHDSFFDDPKNKILEKSELIKQKIESPEAGFKRVVFSGSIASRYIAHADFASMHVSWVYKNLEFFLDRCREGDLNLKYLVFGKHYKYEEISSLRGSIWRSLYLKDENDTVELGPKPKSDLDKLIQILSIESEASQLKDSNLKVGYFKYLLNEIINTQIDE